MIVSTQYLHVYKYWLHSSQYEHFFCCVGESTLLGILIQFVYLLYIHCVRNVK